MKWKRRAVALLLLLLLLSEGRTTYRAASSKQWAIDRSIVSAMTSPDQTSWGHVTGAGPFMMTIPTRSSLPAPATAAILLLLLIESTVAAAAAVDNVDGEMAKDEVEDDDANQQFWCTIACGYCLAAQVRDVCHSAMASADWWWLEQRAEGGLGPSSYSYSLWPTLTILVWIIN